MNPGKFLHPVFIVGCQRSGTTLLAQMIGANRQAILVDENEASMELATSLLDGLEPSIENLQPWLLKAKAKYKDGRAGEEDGPSKDITHLVIKAPNATYEAGRFKQLPYRSTYLFPVRDSRDVVCSMARLAHVQMIQNQIRHIRRIPDAKARFSQDLDRLEKEDLPAHIKRAIIWRIKNSYADFFRAPPLHGMVVRYEDLASDPETHFTRILSHAGLTPGTQMNHEDVMRGMAPGLTMRNRPIDEMSIQRWTRVLTKGEEEDIWNETGEMMQAMGYERQVALPSSRRNRIDSTTLDGPVIATGRGGSGTRLLSDVLQQLGIFLGNRMNASGDSVEWVDLLYEMAIKATLQPNANGSWREEIHVRAAGILGQGNWNPGSSWGWKLPESMLVADKLAQELPGAKFIHLVRNPIDTCLRRTHMTSRTENPIGQATLQRAYSALGWERNPAQDPEHIRNAASWWLQVKLMREVALAFDTRCLEIKYEDLCASPQECADSIATFLDIPTASVEIETDPNRQRLWLPGDPRIGDVVRICGALAEEYGYVDASNA